MTSNFNQRIDLTGRIQNMSFGTNIMPSAGLDSLDKTEGASFKGVMSGLVQNMNKDVNAPDQLLKSAMSGDEDVDIHDVMTAMAKAEIAVNVATQVTTKVVQSYEKIMQISV